MKFIKQSFEIIEQEQGTDGLERIVEMAGRTSYKSEEQITPTSAQKFVKNMMLSKHFTTIEFGTLYIMVPHDYVDDTINGYVEFLRTNSHSRVFDTEDICYITTNWRVLVEHGMAEDMFAFVTKDNLPTRYHYKRHCVKLTTCRQVTHELVRHRVMSFLQESTRYCRYSKGKFNGELTYIELPFIHDEEWNVVPKDDRNFFRKIWDTFRFWIAGVKDPYKITSAEFYYDTLRAIENCYIKLADVKKTVTYKDGVKKEVDAYQAQQLALVLPNLIKADICLCGFEDEWEHLFDLRTSYIKATGMPHFLMCDIIDKVYDEFVARGWAKNRKKTAETDE